MRWGSTGRRGALLVAAGIVVSLQTAVLAGASTTSPNDPYFPEQWNLTRIGAPHAWSRGTGAGVTIGIVDTGIDLTHQDLASKVVASTNCVGANDDPAACHGTGQDDEGHGTHVSGIAAAVTDNGLGVAGVAPGARLVVAKALGSNGSGGLNDVNAGIKWVVDHGARIVNLSVEADSGSLTILPGQSLAEGVEYAYSKGAIAVVAAGNSTPSLFGPNVASVDAIVVGATGRNDEVAFYSSPLTTFKWGLVAPGGDARDPSTGKPSCAGSLASGCIVSTGWFPGGSPNQYADDEGTSMAAPHVAGVLALLMGQGIGLSRDSAITTVLDTAAKISCGPGCHGRLDAAAAVDAADPVSPPTTVAVAPPRPARPTPAPAPPPGRVTSPRAVLTPGPAGSVQPVPAIGSTTPASSPRLTSPSAPSPAALAALGRRAQRRSGSRGASAALDGLAVALLAGVALGITRTTGQLWGDSTRLWGWPARR